MATDPQLADALTTGPVRGRGAGLNPGNRFETVRLHVLGEHLDEVLAELPDGRQVVTRVYADTTRSIINPVDAPDLGFRWTVNPYRGCEHGCIYCYARPGHEMLGLSCGLDFETKIVVKHDAPELLRMALQKPSWKGESIVLSGVTDPYQPIEAKLRITRRCIEVCAEMAQPVSFITKNHLITRDIDLFTDMARHRAVHAALSITTLELSLAAKMEPRASSPRQRLDAVRRLTDAGVPVWVMVAPIIPAINESEIPAILKAAKEAGAVGAGYVLLRLPYQIKALFLEWLQRHFPDRAAKVESALRESRGGELYQSDYFTRQKGTGVRAEQLKRTFEVFKKRYGLADCRESLSSREFLRRRAFGKDQLALFG